MSAKGCDDCAAQACAIERRLADMARRVRSLHDGELAVFDALAIGTEAVPTLRELLFERDPSGIFEPRRWAVQALAALHAFGVLKEFIARWHPASDPVERLGDEAVLSAAARALATAGDETAFAVLFAAAREHPVSGVIEALGCYKRAESIPVLIESLMDDCAARPAQEALHAFGQTAVPALVEATLRGIVGMNGRETPSSIHRRRRALSVLLELGAGPEVQSRIRSLVYDEDDEIAALACGIAITSPDAALSLECAERLVALLRLAARPLRREIEDYLITNIAVARECVEHALRLTVQERSNDLQRARFIRSLQRVLMTVSVGRDGLS